MCLIIIKDKGDKTVSSSILENAAYDNPHGLGILWLDTWQIEKMDSSDWMVLQADRPYIAHFRYKTRGQVNVQNIHPFEIRNGLYLFQNGTNSNLGNEQTSDTAQLATMLNTFPKKHWKNILSITDSRYVIADTYNQSFDIVNLESWYLDCDSGILYSKEPDFTDWGWYSGHDYWGSKYGNYFNSVSDDFELGSYMAVYGTLKRGRGNHHNMGNSEFIGKGKTVEKFPMIANGIPYVSHKPGVGHNIVIELYKVNEKKDIINIDTLEGHPRFYTRKQTNVVVDDKLYTCWMYFCDQDYKNRQLIAEF